ncbi:MAG: tRNA pseudouridine(55) synthase TruB [Acidimicrobiia bacterium]
MPDGFLLIDKQGGCTSHDLVATVRRAIRVKKVGHAGTLDPMATGLVVLGIGRATRLLRFVQELDKEYVTVVAFGVATDTLDADGAVVTREPMEFEEPDLRSVLPRFVGTILQVPPMVSALKLGGRRLYELARRGEEVEREARAVIVHRLELLDFCPGPYPEATIRVRCGKGTYVRSLADDLAGALGGRAHLSSLRRTRIGSLDVESAGVALEEVEQAVEEDRWERLLLAPAEGLTDLPGQQVPPEVARGVRSGMRFAGGLAPEVPEGTPFRVLDDEGRLLAVYRAAAGSATPEVVLS